MIRFISENIEMPDFKQHETIRWIKSVAAGCGKKTGNINYVFCNDDRMLEINRQFLKHDYYTDIITFDYTAEKTISGDIFISLETVSSNADELNVSLLDELFRIIIHGVLHLCGQDDKTPETRAEMTRKENEALETLKGFNE